MTARRAGFLTVLAVVVPVALLAGSAGRRSAGAVPETRAEIEALLTSRLGGHPGAGMVVGMLDASGRRTIIAAGHAGEQQPRPLDGRTVFEIGSVSKVFTAAILADMARRGEVTLDDPVATFLPPGVRVPERDGRQVTLR
jgi:serine-type D-Ala-D-Ala carboxypeptidase/endopeptidase